MYSADMFLESNADGSVIFQLHTEATGIGPVYLSVSGGNLTNGTGGSVAISGSSATGGSADNWFNLKVAFDSATKQAKLYVNNCLIKTVSGLGGDGRFYFQEWCLSLRRLGRVQDPLQECPSLHDVARSRRLSQARGPFSFAERDASHVRPRRIQNARAHIGPLRDSPSSVDSRPR